MNTENDAWGKRFYEKLRKPNFSWISLLDVTRCSDQMTYSLCLPIHYYDSQ